MHRSRSFVAFVLTLLVASCSGGLPESVNSTSGSSTMTPGGSVNPPLPQFSASVTAASPPAVVTFTQADEDGTTSWTWDFGDGSSCTGSRIGSTVLGMCGASPGTPSHTYTVFGVYTVTLTATGPGGTRVERMEDLVEIFPVVPTAAFVPSTTTGLFPLPVSFTNTSANATTYVWDFGDGTPNSTLESPTHTYTSAGIFNVQLTATGFGGTGVESNTITVLTPPPDATFHLRVGGNVVERAVGATPFDVNFVQTFPANTTGRLWNPGNGGATSTAVSPTITYNTPGIFDPSLQATGPGGSDSEIRQDVVEVFDELAGGSFELQSLGQPPAFPWTSFSGNLGGANGHSVLPFGGPAQDLGFPSAGSRWCEIDSQSTNSAVPPSNSGFGTTTNPSVGGAGISQTFSYRPDRTFLSFDATFVCFEPTQGDLYRDWMSVEITLGSTTKCLYYNDATGPLFGPDSGTYSGLQLTSVIQRVVVDLHQLFPSANVTSVFNLRAVVGNAVDFENPSKGFIDDFKLEGVVTDFVGSPLVATVNQSVQFTDLSLGGPNVWSWNFGDGTFSTTQSPAHPYSTSGLKTVSLTATLGSSSETEVKTNYVTVHGTPNVRLEPTTLSLRAPLHVRFQNTTPSNLPGVTYVLDFGDLSTPVVLNQNQTVEHVYTNNGLTNASFNARLTASTPTPIVLTNVDVEPITVPAASRFTPDVYPILNGSTCVGCHDTPAEPGNFEFDEVASTLRAALKGNDTVCGAWNATHVPGRYVVGGQLQNSFLWELVGVTTSTTGCIDIMPDNGPQLDVSIHDKIRSWIEAGAFDN